VTTPLGEPLACVLAGGRARRVGGAKATLPLAGRPLISYPLAALRWAGLQSVVVAKADSPLPAVDPPVWREPAEPVHPAAGIAEALRRAPARPVLAVACDMPLLPPGLLLELARRPERLVVPRTRGRLHPLCARYGPELLEPLEEAIAAGRSLQETIEALGPVEIGEDELALFGEPGVILFNVNTPADLAEAERLLAGGP
jgi:molybdopterin-guanine dinucleotide biosynthesis protein A